MPVRDAAVRETEWFSVYPRLVTLFGDDGTSPEAFRRSLDAAAARGVVGLVDFEFGGSREAWAERWAEDCDVLRVRWATYADTLDEVIAAGLRTGDPLPGCDERITMGPLKIISDGSLNTRTAWCCEPYSDAHRLEYPAGQPNLSGDELRDLLKRATGAASRSPPTRSVTRRSRRRSRRTPRPARSARSSTPSWSAATTYAGWPSSASGPASSRRTCSTTATSPSWPGRAGRALLRVPLDARRRRRARPRLGRAGLAARPVAGDRGRGAPQRRRARPLARRAGAHAGRGPGRLRRRPADRRCRAHPATWSCSTPTRWPSAATRPGPVRRSAPCRSP